VSTPLGGRASAITHVRTPLAPERKSRDRGRAGVGVVGGVRRRKGSKSPPLHCARVSSRQSSGAPLPLWCLRRAGPAHEGRNFLGWVAEAKSSQGLPPWAHTEQCAAGPSRPVRGGVGCKRCSSSVSCMAAWDKFNWLCALSRPHNGSVPLQAQLRAITCTYLAEVAI